MVLTSDLMKRISAKPRPAVCVPALLLGPAAIGAAGLTTRFYPDGPADSALAWGLYVALFGLAVQVACSLLAGAEPVRPGDDRAVQVLLTLRRNRLCCALAAALAGLGLGVAALAVVAGAFPRPGTLAAGYGAMLALGWLILGHAASDRAVHRALARLEGRVDQRGRAAASRASASIAGQSPAATRSFGTTQLPPTQRTLASLR